MLTQLRTCKKSHKKQLPVHPGEDSAGGLRCPGCPPPPSEGHGWAKQSTLLAACFKSRGHSGGWNESVPIYCFLACGEKSWRPGLWHAETGAAPPQEKSPGRAALPTQSAERDTGQGSAGFSSFDGHGTRFDMVRGLVFILFLFFFFFCFNLLLAMGLLAFYFYFFFQR